MRLSSCKMLLETVCQKLESMVLPGTESAYFHAMAAGIVESRDAIGTTNVDVDRIRGAIAS